MRRALTTLAVVSVLSARIAFAKDDPPPPPPPPPPSDSASDSGDKKEGDAPTIGDFKSTDALLDASKGKHRPMMLTFFTGIHYPSYSISLFGFILGARFNIPVIHDGFVPQINDSFDIEFGLDLGIVPLPFGYGSYIPIYVHPMLEPRYTVYLLNKLAVYVKPLTLGFIVWPNSFGFQSLWFHWEASIGAMYQLSKSFYVRAEIGTFGLRAGIGIAF